MLNNQNLKTSPKTRKNTKYLLLVSSLIFMGMTSTAHAWAWEIDEGSPDQEECEPLNTQDIPDIDDEHISAIALQEVKEKVQEIFGDGEWEDSPETVSEGGVWGIVESSQNFLCTTDERIY